MGKAIFNIYLIGAILLVCLFIFDPITNLYNAILHHTYASVLSLADPCIIYIKSMKNKTKSILRKIFFTLNKLKIL